MGFLEKGSLREDLLLKEGKLEHELRLAQDKLRKIRDRKKEVEEALKQIDSSTLSGVFDPSKVNIQISDLVKDKDAGSEQGKQIKSFCYGLIMAMILMLLMV